jgi:nucleoside-diphosphate-sugar epimerase
MKVLVTGANGFVGTSVCRRLLAEGWPVVGAVRTPQRLLPGVQARLIAPIGPITPWAAVLDGVEAVVHLAGRAHVMRETVADPEAAFHRVNTEGTLHLAREALRRGVRQFLFMSSVKVNGEATSGTQFTFEDAPAPADAYGRSKWEAEQGLARLVPSGGGHFRVTIFRPPLVYGPGVGGNFRQLLRVVAKGWPLPLAAIDNRRSLIGVDNLADAVTTALREPAAAYETFLLSDGEDVSTPELIRRLAQAMGRPARLWSMRPERLLRLGRLIGREAAVRRLVESLEVRGTAFRQRFDWKPPKTLDQGLAETASWFAGTR